MTDAVRRFFGKFSFLSALLIIVAFVAFTILISKPLRGTQRHGLVQGTVTASTDIRRAAPLVFYVALNRGEARPAREAPEFPLDDRQPEPGETYELSADKIDGNRFWLLARVETAELKRWCEVVALPPVRRLENGDWVDARTGKRLPLLTITIDRGTAC